MRHLEVGFYTKFILFVFKHGPPSEAHSESCHLSRHTCNRPCSEIPILTPTGQLPPGQFSILPILLHLTLTGNKTQSTQWMEARTSSFNKEKAMSECCSPPCSFIAYGSGVVCKLWTSTVTCSTTSAGLSGHMLSSTARDCWSASSYRKLSSVMIHWPWMYRGMPVNVNISQGWLCCVLSKILH